jgi:ketosteroid isomerase-like protein
MGGKKAVERSWSWLATAVAAGFLTVAAGAEPPPSAEEAVRQAVVSANRAYAANDLEAYFGHYAQELTQWWPSGRNDLPRYRREWEAFVGAGGRVLRADVSDLVVQLSPAGDAAVASYRLDVETKGTDGASTRETLQETDVLFRGDAGWRIVHLHYSLPSPTQ